MFSWKEHPLLKNGAKDVVPALMAWFEIREEQYDYTVTGRGLYTMRGSRFKLINDKYDFSPEGLQLGNYDYMRTPNVNTVRTDVIKFELTRAARVCLILSIDDPAYKFDRNEVITIPGFPEGLGVASWDKDSPMPENHEYGQPAGYRISVGLTVCRQQEAGLHDMPHPSLLNAKYKIRAYNILLGEASGSAPPPTSAGASYTGPEIEQQKLCPNELHDMWVVDGHDDADEEVSSRKWLTWHPQRDPLFNCYYGHEHGSPGMLAGYTERFHYTALKNNYQDESHVGFKGFVAPVDDHWIYVNIHADLTTLRRVNTQFHTMVIAVTDRTTGELMYEMSCKADFGGSMQEYEAGMAPPGEVVFPLGNRYTQQLAEDTFAPRRPDRIVRSKRINYIRPHDLEPGLRYKKKPEMGIYEEWIGGGNQYCTRFGYPFRRDGITFDFKDSITACRNPFCSATYFLNVPSNEPGKKAKPRLGANRELIFTDMTIGDEHCPFDLPPRGEDGVFYTDQFCTEVFDGPGPNRVKQIYKPTFSGLHVDGSYGVSDVHGRYPYMHRGFENPLGGLRGVSQDQSALGITAREPSEPVS